MAHPLKMNMDVLSRTVIRSIRPPLLTPTIFSGRQSQFTEQCRFFSQGLAPRAMKSVRPGMMTAQSITPKMAPEKSMRNRMKEIPLDQIPSDFGLLPGTFVRPEGKNMPSFFKDPRLRLRMEWVWVKMWFQNVIQSIMYHKSTFKGLPLELRQRRQIGRNLHSKMYTEFARGNEQFIRANCSPGLATNLVKRIKKRNNYEQVSWVLNKYIRTPYTYFTGVRVLSDRATTIPGMTDSGVRQVVLCIKSQQTSQTHSSAKLEGFHSSSPPRTQDCTEYIVIQKVMIGGVQKDWEIWGFIKPTTVEELDMPWFATGLSLKERLQTMQDMMMGKQ